MTNADCEHRRIGRATADGIDVEFAVNPDLIPQNTASSETGIFSVIPTNIFLALSSNTAYVRLFRDYLWHRNQSPSANPGTSFSARCATYRPFASQFLIGSASWYQSGSSLSIAPQVALLGPERFTARAASRTHFLLQPAFCCCCAPYCFPRYRYVRPQGHFCCFTEAHDALGASTRNTLICIPIALEALEEDLKIKRDICDLYVPLGFATIRFGTILYFIVATLFMGTLMGRPFGLIDLGLVAAFSIAASFATLGLNGLAALAPLAVVLRPFGLSYEVAVPLMIIIDPLAELVRVMLNVVINCTIPILANGREAAESSTIR